MSAISINRKTKGLADLIASTKNEILDDWIREMAAATRRTDLMKESEVRSQCSVLLRLMQDTLISGGSEFRSDAWDKVREMLGNISASRAQQGFSPSDTATFVFSAKRPLLNQLRKAYKNDAEGLAGEVWLVSELLDSMGLYTAEVYQRTREDIIKRQQQDLLELSTPIVKLWEGILALPIIGTLDSARTQVVMESLLQAIVDSNSRVAIIDITGVPIVDTVVAQHLLKTVTAAKLMGADCIISGVRPQIAQTIVHLGINLKDVTTKATLATALEVALDKLAISAQPSGAKTHHSTDHPYSAEREYHRGE